MSFSHAELVARRIAAYGARRALPLASAFSQGADPRLNIGVCTIKIVTEEQVQAIAFGRIGQEPTVIARMDPLSRDVSDLEPFAEFMAGIGDLARAGAKVRLWTPHQSAMETIDLLGHRYATNKEAPDIVRAMGVVCRAFGAQLRHKGQPIVSCGLEQLLTHFITGQSPAEDRHLAATLTWIEANGDDSVFADTRTAAVMPASGILPNLPGRMDDARVESLRRSAKKTKCDVERANAHAEMRALLEAAALREWDLMMRARAALLRLVATTPVDTDLSKESHERLLYHLGGGATRVVQPHAVALVLKDAENADAGAARRGWRHDSVRRDAAVRRGRVIRGTIVSVGPFVRGGPAPIVEIATRQPIVRFRVGDDVSPLDTGYNITGELDDLGVGADPSERIIRIRVTEGKTFTHRAFVVGAVSAWEAKAVDLVIRERKMSKHIAERAPWVLGSPQPADAGAGAIPAGDLVHAANALVKP